jgi:hypothetical protein
MYMFNFGDTEDSLWEMTKDIEENEGISNSERASFESKFIFYVFG